MKSVRSSAKILFWVALFAIAMGYLESAVVIYIREIYYPEGFSFPLKVLDSHILITEIFREAATLVMLIGIGVVAGRSSIERFGLFIYSFGWWDIFYYVFLKVLIGWPESLYTWDILFMLPTTWVGPVIAPMLNALVMIFFGGLITYYQGKNKSLRIKAMEWIILISGAGVLLITYLQDYSRYMLERYSFSELFLSIPDQNMMDYATQYIPKEFNWILFIIGQVLISLPVLWYFLRLNKKRRSTK
jgi:hypothetical protein